MYGQNSGTHRQSFHSRPSNRNFSTGRMGDQPEQPQDYDQEEINNPTQEPSPQISREPQHNGSYVVVPPNQAKRDKLLTMAKTEEEEYNRYVESHRPGPICLTPKKLGGQTSEAKARQQQQLTQSQSKIQKKLQRDEYKRRLKEEEDAKLQQMKDCQRKKAEKLKEKRCQEDRERSERWHKDMLQKRSAFLDQLSQSASSSSSYNSYNRVPSAWEKSLAEEHDWDNNAGQDEEWMVQLALKESLKMKMEEDQKREKFVENQHWQASQISYRKQLQEEEERKLQQMKEEHCRKKMEKDRRRQEMEVTEPWQKMEKDRRRQEMEVAEPWQAFSSCDGWMQCSSGSHNAPITTSSCSTTTDMETVRPSSQASRQSYRSYRQQLKEDEESKLKEMKEEQRRKSELLEAKKSEEENERKVSQQEEQRRVNNAFLDRLQRLGTRQQEYSGESNTWA